MATYKQIIDDLHKKKYAPIYLLMGEESYYIDEITAYIAKNVLTDDEKTFNQTVMYGKDVVASVIDNSAKRFPMMAERQVVIVKEAQEVKDLDRLSFYASKPVASTVLVISYKNKSLAKTTKLYKAIEKNGVVLESKKLYDNQVAAWVEKHIQEKGYTTTPEAAVLLGEFLGTSLSKLANEIEKLTISLPKGTTITPKHIEDNIGISKDFNNFELQKALGTKDILKANRIINYFAANPKDNPAMLTIVALYSYFSKLLLFHVTKDKSRTNIASVLKVNPYFVADYEKAGQKYNAKKVVKIISALREYDMRFKGVNNTSTSHGDLLKELIYIVLH